MSIIMKISQRIPLQSVLKTPSGKAQFEFYHVDRVKVIIRTEKGSLIKIPAPCLEYAPNFLRGKGWIRIGALHETSHDETLDSFVKRFSHGTSLASYVAPLLELAEIAEIDRSRPAKIRVKAPY